MSQFKKHILRNIFRGRAFARPGGLMKGSPAIRVQGRIKLRMKPTQIRLSQNSRLRRTSLAHISEFVACICLFVILILPFINLLSVITGYATICFLNQQCASRIAKQRSYSQALAVLKEESDCWLTSPFAAFARLNTNSGYKGCGNDLYVEATNFQGNAITAFGPNTPVPPPLDPQTFVYEYAVKSTFEAGPLISMSNIPLLKEIPGLGKPCTLTYRSTKAVEHLKGLSGNGLVATVYTGGSMAFPAPALQAEGPAISQATVGGWNHPDIYEQIKAAGQKVLAQDVIIVHANNSYWTPSNLDIPAGAKLWIDYRADGQWSTDPAAPVCDADGVDGGFSGYLPNDGLMIGKIGVDGRAFKLGKARWNMALDGKGTGKLYLGASETGGSSFQGHVDSFDLGLDAYSAPLVNDGFAPNEVYADNSGTIEVRVVVAR